MPCDLRLFGLRRAPYGYCCQMASDHTTGATSVGMQGVQCSVRHISVSLVRGKDRDPRARNNKYSSKSQIRPLIYTTIAALSPKSVLTNLSSKWYFYPHGLNSTPIIAYIFLRIHVAQPQPLDRSLLRLSFVFLRQQIKKNFASPQLRCLDAIFTRQFSRRCRHRRLLKTAHDFARLRTTTHDYAQLSTMVDFIVL